MRLASVRRGLPQKRLGWPNPPPPWKGCSPQTPLMSSTLSVTYGIGTMERGGGPCSGSDNVPSPPPSTGVMSPRLTPIIHVLIRSLYVDYSHFSIVYYLHAYILWGNLDGKRSHDCTLMPVNTKERKLISCREVESSLHPPPILTLYQQRSVQFGQGVPTQHNKADLCGEASPHPGWPRPCTA